MPATRSTDKSLWGHASTPVFYHPVQHADHQFISIQKIPVFVAQSGRVPNSAFAPFTDDDFAIAHDPGFVQGVFSMRLSNGFGTRDESVNNALRYSSASLWAATDHVLGPEGSGPRRIACSATQGFHHSGYDFAGGYCTFNGLVIAARKAMRQYPDIGRVLIIDGDGHYGNGTDDIIRRGNLTTIINITRPDIGPDGDGGPHSSFTATDWLEWTADLITTHRPGLILFQSGGDAWSSDPYGAGYLSREALLPRRRGIHRCRDGGNPAGLEPRGWLRRPDAAHDRHPSGDPPHVRPHPRWRDLGHTPSCARLRGGCVCQAAPVPEG